MACGGGAAVPGKARHSATEVEVIIVATVNRTCCFLPPRAWCRTRLGAKGAWGFDLSAACSGFLYALQVGAKLVESGAHDKVSGDRREIRCRRFWITPIASTCILFGDGAGAVLLEPAAEGEVGFIDFVHEIDGSGGVALNMPGGGSLNPATHETVDKKMHFVHQDGQAVYKYAVRKMAEASERVLERNGYKGRNQAADPAPGEQADHSVDCGPAGTCLTTE